MPRRGVQPGRLRRRLTIAFVLVAGISAGALALGSYLLVRQARLHDSVNRAKTEALRELRAAGSVVASAPAGAFEVQNLLAGPESSGIHALFVAGAGGPTPSSPSVDPPIPADLRTLVDGGRLAFRRVAFGGTPYLIMGSRIPGSTDELYLLFDEHSLFHDLGVLRDVLVLGWLGVILVAAVVGRTLAKGTLEPVGRASEAARHIAQGLLETRLEETGGDEFGAWAASFNRMAEALEAKVAALSEAQARERRFTSDVAHELRTPVAALVGEASLLREHLDRMPDDARRLAELVVHDVARLRRLVEDLMEISRLDAGREPVQPETVDVVSLVKAVVRTRGWLSGVTVEGDGGALWTDPRRLERVMANLVGNAVEHGRRDVRVWIGTVGQDLVVEVSDRGPGISADNLPHLFERFYKSDPARAGGGSGLGLAIVQENVRLLGGEIEVRSEVGVGTQFRVVLPVTKPLRTSDVTVSAPTDHEAQSPSSEGGT